MQHSRPGTSSIDCSGIFSGEISLDEFLRDYWQQKPLLIRNAFPGFSSPLTPEELAGLSCEEEVNARIVIEKHAERPWTVRYGPFDEDDFAELPQDHWTLLVSDVEKHVPSARAIMDCFDFIPDWRKDDLMLSYAPEGGSVGPHTDAYDVFLLQAYGRRKWMISHKHAGRFLENTDLSILASFSADEEWVLEPGDMLYLPPGIAHHGIATEACITCSIGFRAPSVRTMVADYAEHVAREITPELRYTDAGLIGQKHPAEISHSALETVTGLLRDNLVIDKQAVHHWFGEYMSEARAGTHTEAPGTQIVDATELQAILDSKTDVTHSPASRFLFIRDEYGAILFADGKSYPVSRKFAISICHHQRSGCAEIKQALVSEMDRHALQDLYNRGCLTFSDDTE